MGVLRREGKEREGERERERGEKSRQERDMSKHKGRKVDGPSCEFEGLIFFLSFFGLLENTRAITIAVTQSRHTAALRLGRLHDDHQVLAFYGYPQRGGWMSLSVVVCISHHGHSSSPPAVQDSLPAQFTWANHDFMLLGSYPKKLEVVLEYHPERQRVVFPQWVSVVFLSPARMCACVCVVSPWVKESSFTCASSCVTESRAIRTRSDIKVAYCFASDASSVDLIMSPS